MKCVKRFRTPRGTLQNQRQCKVQAKEETNTDETRVVPEKYYWGDIKE